MGLRRLWNLLVRLVWEVWDLREEEDEVREEI